MGRKQNNRVNGERLRIAIERSGMKPVEFGKLLYMTKNRKTASTNVYRLCLPDGHKNKIGLDIALLHDASKLLNVREEWLISNDEDDIMTDFEQKCWIAPKSDEAAKRLNDLIFDINPAEICAQIEADNLKKWCEIIQTEMKMAMVQLPCWTKDGNADETRT